MKKQSCNIKFFTRPYHLEGINLIYAHFNKITQVNQFVFQGDDISYFPMN